MRVTTKIVLDIETGAVIEHESFEYSGPTAQSISGSGSSQKSKQKSQSTQESGTKYNEDFLNQARAFASGGGGGFDAAAYLRDNPDVASNPYYGSRPLEHYTAYGKDEGRAFPTLKPSTTDPTYNPQYVKGAYTPVAPEGFAKLEDTLYGTQSSKLSQAYNQAMNQQREQLAQSGALNSPSQFLEGSARSSLDRSYIQGLQQAARDAFTGRFGLEEAEAARKTGFDVGEAGRRTAYDTGEAARRTGYDTGEATRRTAFDTGEAGRETGFNEQTAARILDLWLKKLGIAIEAGRYTQGQMTSQATGSNISGSGGIFQFGGSSSS